MDYDLKPTDRADRVDRILSVIAIALTGLIGAGLVLISQFKT